MEENDRFRGNTLVRFHGILLHRNGLNVETGGRILCKHDGATEAMSQYIYYPVIEPITAISASIEQAAMDLMRNSYWEDYPILDESPRWLGPGQGESYGRSEPADKVQEIMNECRQWTDEDLQSIRRVLTQEGKRRKNESQ